MIALKRWDQDSWSAIDKYRLFKQNILPAKSNSHSWGDNWHSIFRVANFKSITRKLGTSKDAHKWIWTDYIQNMKLKKPVPIFYILSPKELVRYISMNLYPSRLRHRGDTFFTTTTLKMSLNYTKTIYSIYLIDRILTFVVVVWRDIDRFPIIRTQFLKRLLA